MINNSSNTTLKDVLLHSTHSPNVFQGILGGTEPAVKVNSRAYRLNGNKSAMDRPPQSTATAAAVKCLSSGLSSALQNQPSQQSTNMNNTKT